MSEKHGGREWVAVDIDATLTEAPFKEGFLAPIGDMGLQLLRLLKEKGLKVLLYTGHMNEDRGNLERNVVMVDEWVRAQGIGHLVDRVWPYPKPDVRCIIDDKCARWRGDPDMTALQVMSAADWVDAYKAAMKKEA